MISREEAIERLERMLDETQVVCNSYTATEPIRHALKKDEETYRMAIEALSNERPKGRWIVEGSYTVTARVCRCTNCNREITVDDFDDYCPNCGAEMERGERE